MEIMGYTATESLRWDYSETEQYYVLAIPPARLEKTLYLVTEEYAYQWFGLNGHKGLKVVYYPFMQINFMNLHDPCDCPPEIIPEPPVCPLPIIILVTPNHGVVPIPPPAGNFGLTTTPGTYSVDVPVGMSSLLAEAWGAGGGSGGGNSSASVSGGGGGYSAVTLTVTAGQTIYYTVGAGAPATVNDGVKGGDSWVNVTANAVPTSGQGCIGGGGAGGVGNTPGIGGAGTIGTTNFTGGDGVSAGSSGSGGGGGAGSAGNGSNASGATGGTGGTPDGGAGGTGAAGSGTGGNGVQPGGAAGSSWLGTTGKGGDGQVRLTVT